MLQHHEMDRIQPKNQIFFIESTLFANTYYVLEFRNKMRIEDVYGKI